MPRLAVGVEYDGTEFAGWQSQRGVRTIQAAVESAVTKVAAASVVVQAAGRTDTGVHASGQVAHFDAGAARTQRQWLLGINSLLPNDVAIRWVRSVPAEFDARRTALWRRYRYLVHQSPVRPALSHTRAWWLTDALDCATMRSAATAWIGEHDFSAFRAAGCQSHTPWRCVHSIEVHEFADIVAFEITANAFLYHMVRNLVGTLVEIGRHRQPPEWANELLQGRDRKLAAATAPAAGLTLAAIGYPAEYDLPEPQGGLIIV